MKQGPEGPDYTYYSQRHPENYHNLAHIADEIGVSTHQLGAKTGRHPDTLDDPATLGAVALHDCADNEAAG